MVSIAAITYTMSMLLGFAGLVFLKSESFERQVEEAILLRLGLRGNLISGKLGKVCLLVGVLLFCVPQAIRIAYAEDTAKVKLRPLTELVVFALPSAQGCPELVLVHAVTPNPNLTGICRLSFTRVCVHSPSSNFEMGSKFTGTIKPDGLAGIDAQPTELKHDDAYHPVMFACSLSGIVLYASRYEAQLPPPIAAAR